MSYSYYSYLVASSVSKIFTSSRFIGPPIGKKNTGDDFSSQLPNLHTKLQPTQGFMIHEKGKHTVNHMENMGVQASQ